MPEPEPVDISVLDTEIGRHDPRGTDETLTPAHIDPDQHATVDLAKPIYLARLTHPTRPNDHVGIRPIDGWQQICRARSVGTTHLPGILVPDDIAQAASLPVLV